MPVLHKKWLVQTVGVLQLHIGYWIKVASHHRANWIPRGKISHYESNERYTDDNEDEANKPFDQELKHSEPLVPLLKGFDVYRIACSTIPMFLLSLLNKLVSMK